MTGGSRHGRTLRLAASVGAGLGVVVAGACYSSGGGKDPPPNVFYYPVGLTVSGPGDVLYAVNSDFDLQYNGGTVQSYDLTAIRNDVVALLLGDFKLPDGGLMTPDQPVDAGSSVEDGGSEGGFPSSDAGDAGTAPDGSGDSASDDGGDAGDDGAAPDASDGEADAAVPDAGSGAAVFDAGLEVPADLPFEAGVLAATAPGCPNTNLGATTNPNVPNGGWNNQPGRLPLGQACAPPMDSTAYFKDSVTIGAFATDIQFSKNHGRLFIPVRGDATITWIDIDPKNPFHLDCGPRKSGNRCADANHAGLLTDEYNTRQLQMPGEPFAMALSEDGTAIALTHQAENQTSLYLTGFLPNLANAGIRPSIQFIVQDLPLGGDGIVAIPHDPAALPNADPANPLRPAFLQTSNQQPEIDLLRYYTDEGYQQALDAGTVLIGDEVAVPVGSSNLRPFLIKERSYAVTVSANGSNSRGIAVDPTPRIACEASAIAQGFAVTSPEYVTCAQTPARLFVASRSPPSLIVGQVGGWTGDGQTYDPDQLAIIGNVPLSAGPSNVYVAPIVDGNGNYSVRVFVVCFDSQTIAIYDPDAQRVENVVTTGPGPFAMTFDPFDLEAVAVHAPVPWDPRSTHRNIWHGAVIGPALRAYRFAYITSFTDSFVQIMDLDQSFQDDRLGPGQSTFENIVYTLGLPTLPVGSSQSSH